MKLTKEQVTELRKSTALAELVLDILAEKERAAFTARPASPVDPSEEEKVAYNLLVDSYEEVLKIKDFHRRYSRTISDSKSEDKRIFCLALGDFVWPDSIRQIDTELDASDKQKKLLDIVATATINGTSINIIEYLIEKMYRAVMFPPVRFKIASQ